MIKRSLCFIKRIFLIGLFGCFFCFVFTGALANSADQPASSKKDLPFRLSETSPQPPQWNAVEQMDLKTAKVQIHDRMQVIDDLIRQQTDPYSGAKSGGINCDPKKLPPALKNSTAQETYEAKALFSSKTHVLGDCSGTPNDLRTQYLLLYCTKQKSLYTIRFFYSQTEPWHPKPLAHCL